MTYPTVPCDDLIAHEQNDCVCGPLVVPIVRAGGGRADVTIHRRLDGRVSLAPIPDDDR
jgi:hypothetical protein